MNNKKVLSDLEKMKGRTFQYGNNIHYIRDIKIDDEKEKCEIITNLDSFDRPFDAIAEFIKYWKPVSNVSAIPTEEDQNYSMAIFFEQGDSLSNNLIDILNDNIKKVQANKDYIPQATAINNNVNTIVNIAKLRLDIANKFKRPLKVKTN